MVSLDVEKDEKHCPYCGREYEAPNDSKPLDKLIDKYKTVLQNLIEEDMGDIQKRPDKELQIKIATAQQFLKDLEGLRNTMDINNEI